MVVFTVMVRKPRLMPGVIAGRVLQRLPGFVAATREQGGMIAAFGTVRHAESARLHLYGSGWAVGKYIMIADVDPELQEMTVHRPVEGWKNVDPADIEQGPDGERRIWDYLQNRRQRKREQKCEARKRGGGSQNVEGDQENPEV